MSLVVFLSLHLGETNVLPRCFSYLTWVLQLSDLGATKENSRLWCLMNAYGRLLFLFILLFIFGRRDTYYLLEAFTEILRVIETGHIGYL